MALRALRPPFAPAAALVLCSLGGLSSACDGGFVNLGASGDALMAGSAGSLATAGSGGSGEEWSVSAPLLAVENFQISNPTLTADQHHLYYTLQKDGDDVTPARVMHATFDGQKLGDSVELPLPADRYGFGSPAISADGDELWLSRFNEQRGDTDIWRAGQGDSWGELVLVPELSSMFGDEPRPPAVGGTLMPLSSKRQGQGVLPQIYFATRGADGTWSAPNQDHLASINSLDYLSADGFLSVDGLSLYFASKRTGNAELYVARRASRDEDFGEPTPLLGVNTASEERMPWLSADERTLYFASDRLGSYALYVATREAP
jgi:hypothetical protein